MGSWIAMLATSCACTCCASLGSSVLGCCGSASKKHSVIGRILYAVILMLMCVLAWVLRNLPAWLESISYLQWIPGFNTCSSLGKPASQTPELWDDILHTIQPVSIPEALCYGTMSVYRVSSSLAAFHLLLALIMLGVKSKKDPRATLQHRWWPIKVLLLLALVAAVFFIPNNVFIGYGYVSLAGSLLFILIQLVLLVDFAHSWNESWVSKYSEEDGKKMWLVLLAVATVLMYAVSLVLTILMFVYFMENSDVCWMNTMFISVNLAGTFLVSMLSIIPYVREKNPRSGLLQSSVVTLYSTYLIWSALASEPNEMGCNKFYKNAEPNSAYGGFSLFLGVAFTFLALVYTAIQSGSSGHDLTTVDSSSSDSVDKKRLLKTILDNARKEDIADAKRSLVVNNEEDNDTAVPLDDMATSTKGGEIEEALEESDKHHHHSSEEEEESSSDEATGVAYNYSFFHFTFFLAALYLSMVLTNWQTVSTASETGIADASAGASLTASATFVRVDQGMASVWVKVVSSWLVLILYVWTVFAPVCFPNRRFV